jgi:tetratricopeptide (TPR) repeat protein/tRNA A-37 threonylcarbamoyl transferase component Bud32
MNPKKTEKTSFLRYLLNGFLNYLMYHKGFSRQSLQECLQKSYHTQKPITQILIQEGHFTPQSLEDCFSQFQTQEFKTFDHLGTQHCPDFYPKQTLEDLETSKAKFLDPLPKNTNSFSFLWHSPQPLQRYEILETLGQGGMGVVQRVKDCILGREVALKRIRLEKGVSTSNQQHHWMLWRLKREAMITATLEHPHIVPLYEYQQEEVAGDLCFTMRRIEGKTLHYLLKKRQEGLGNFPQEKIFSTFLKICDALAYAHSKGIIHRDIKSTNIMLGSYGEVYVMDWGIAKCKEEEKEPDFFLNTRPSRSLFFQTMGSFGTPGYMAPEQARNAHKVDTRADIYSLGKLLEECFTGITPSEAKKREAQKFIPKSEESKNALSIPKEIQAIIEKATEEQREKRYSSIKAFIEDLENFQKNLPISALPPHTLNKIKMWSQRHKRFLILSFSLLFSFLSFYHLLRYQEEKREYSQATQKFYSHYQYFLKTKEFEIPENQKTLSKTSKFALFEALDLCNTALALAPHHQEMQYYQQLIGKELLYFTCEEKNYEFADSLARQLQRNPLLSLEEKEKISHLVTEERNKQLKEHQECFDFWKNKLRKIEAFSSKFLQEKAILEISKMPEEEIYQQVLHLVKEGIQYFLKQENTTTLEDEYYRIFTIALGWMARPESKTVFLQALHDLKAKALLTPSQIPEALLKYMITLVEALEKTPHCEEIAIEITQIRESMGATSLFTEQTYFLSQTLIERGIAYCSQKIQQSPSLAYWYVQRSLQYQAQKNYLEAKRDIQYALKLAPEEGSYYYQRGQIFTKQGLFDQALEDFESCLKYQPQHLQSYLAIARLKQDSHPPETVLKYYEQALSCHTQEAEVYFQRALFQEKRGELQAAIADYTQSLKHSPQQSEVYNRRGRLQKQRGLLTESLDDYNQALRLNPYFAGCYNNRGIVKYEMKDFEGALEDYNKAIYYHPQQTEAYLNRGFLKREHFKNPQDALKDYNYAILVNPQIPRTYLQRAFVYYELSQLPKAIEDCLFALQLQPHCPKLHEHCALFLLENQENEKAIVHFQKALEYTPPDLQKYQTWRSLGIAFYQIKSFHEAITALEKALKLLASEKTEEIQKTEPFLKLNLAQIHQQQGQELYSQGKFSLALKEYHCAMAYHPNDPKTLLSLYHQLSTLYLALKNEASALETLRKVLKINPKDEKALLEAGSLCLKNNETQEEGLEYLWLASETYPKNLEVKNTLNSFYFKSAVDSRKKNLFKHALQSLDFVLEYDPQNAIAYYEKAVNFYSLNNLRQALTQIEQAIHLQPQNSLFYLFQCQIYHALKNYSQAHKAGKKALELENEDLSLFIALTQICNEEERWDETIALAQKALKCHSHPQIFSDFALALKVKILQYLHLKDFQKADEALHLFEQNIPKEHPAFLLLPHLKTARKNASTEPAPSLSNPNSHEK